MVLVSECGWYSDRLGGSKPDGDELVSGLSYRDDGFNHQSIINSPFKINPTATEPKSQFKVIKYNIQSSNLRMTWWSCQDKLMGGKKKKCIDGNFKIRMGDGWMTWWRERDEVWDRNRWFEKTEEGNEDEWMIEITFEANPEFDSHFDIYRVDLNAEA